MAKITYDGATREIDDAIAKDDDLLRKVLAASVPNMEHVEFVRGTKDDVTEVNVVKKSIEVTVVKKAQSKGNQQSEILNAFLEAPEYKNPAVDFALKKLEAEETGDNGFMFRAIRSGAASRAAKEGADDCHECELAFFTIINVAPIPSKEIPLGF